MVIGCVRLRRWLTSCTKRRYSIILCCTLFVLWIQYDTIGIMKESSVSIPPTPPSGHLEEIRHVAYLKVHKTGSSTIQNIFIRFGDSRNLTFILGRVSRADQECRGWSSCISLKKTLSDDVIVPPPRDRKYEIMCSHVVYDKQMFSKYLPSDTKLIASVRDPIKRLESAIAHFKLIRGTNLSSYANDPLKYDHPMLNNVMAFEFGFDKRWFPTKNNQRFNSLILPHVTTYLKQVIEDFHLILVNERLDESLVLMRRLLNWNTQDILYSNKLSRSHNTFNEHDVTNLHKYLYLDYRLYNYAVEVFENKIANSGPGFNEELADFKIVKSKVLTFCNTAKHTSRLNIERTAWHQSFVVSKKLCNDIHRQEFPYLNLIRQKQYGTLETL